MKRKPLTEEHKIKLSNAMKKYCSLEEVRKKRSEQNKGKNNPFYGKHLSEEAKLKVGLAQKGKIISEEHKIKIRIAQKGKPKLNIRDEKHPNWKADNVGNRALHQWLRRHLPKPEDGLCMLCKKNTIFDMACITGIYNREFKNWAWFCHSCNMIWDNAITKGWITRRLKKNEEWAKDNE